MPHRKQHEGHQAVSNNNNRTANSTTAGKLQRFYKEHSTPSGTSAAAATLTAGRLCGPQKFKKGDDVLQHYAKNGLDAAPKLVHCLQASAAAGTAQHAAGTADPYELTFVPRAQLPACYCTLTATGVVQVSGDGEPSLHTPIGTWLRHASLHQVFAGLPAGQYMLKNSVLRSWQAKAQQQRFQQRRQQLSQRLLLLKPNFHRVLGESRARLAQLAAQGPLAPMEEGVFKLQALVDTQQEYQQAKLGPLLARVTAGIVADVEQLAGRLQSSERLLRREVEDYKNDPSAGASQGLCSIKIKAERASITAKHTSARHDLQRLPCFIRLLAQLILQSQLDLLVSAVSGLRQHLQVPGNALQVDLLLQAPGGVTTNPSQDETLKGLSKGVLEHMVGLLIAAPRLLKHCSMAALLEDPIHTNVANFQRGSTPGMGSSAGCAASSSTDGSGGMHRGPAVVSGKALRASADASAQAAAAVTLSAWLSEGAAAAGEGRPEGGQLLLMVVGDNRMQAQRRTLDQLVMRSYREAQQVTDALSDLGVLLRFACMWDPKAYKRRQHTVAGLRRDTHLIREWRAQLQMALDAQCVGMLTLETGALKAAYTNTLKSAQATIAMLMVVAGRRAAEAAVGKLQAVTSELAQQPSKLPDFITFRLHVRGVRQQQEDLLVLLPAQVADLYACVTEWGFSLPHADQGLLEDLREAVRGCSAALTAAAAFLDSRQLGMVSLLDRQAKELLLQVQDLLKRLEAAAMAQRLGVAPRVSASDWQQRISQLSQAASLVNEQEQQLDMRCTHFGDLEEARRTLQEMQEHAAQACADAAAAAAAATAAAQELCPVQDS